MAEEGGSARASATHHENCESKDEADSHIHVAPDLIRGDVSWGG